MTDTSGTDDTGRLSGLVEEIKAKITEIKAQVEPALQQLAADAQAKVQEISDTIDQKLNELGQALVNRTANPDDAGAGQTQAPPAETPPAQ